MAIDPSISLGVRPPVIQPMQIQSPLEQYGKILSLRNLMTQGQLGQLNVQQTQLENAKLQQSAQEEQNLGSWMQQNQGRQDLTPQEIIAANPNAAGVKYATAWSAQQKANMDAHAAALTNHLNNQKAIDREVQGVIDNPTKNAALATAVKNGWLTSDQAAPYLSMDVADPQWKDFTTRVQAQTLDATQRAEAAKNLIDLRIKQATEVPVTQKAIAEATTAQQIAAGTQPITLQQKIANEQAAAAAAETARQHAQQNAFEAARLGIEKTKSAREEKIYQQTYGTGANPALVGVDPKLRTQVTKEAQKVGDEYLKAQEAADQMQSLIELTKTGNKAAGSNLPLIGVETLNAINGIKRINKDEIKQYSGAGSLYDKIVGKLEGAAVGQPIPADVLKDIETMHNTLRQGAESSYKTRLQGINDNYKSNFQPVRTPGAATGKPPEITSQAAYDALPKGTRYMHNGEVLTKK